MLGYGYYFDPTYLLVIIGAVLSIWASSRVNSTYNKYSRVRSMTGMTGAEAARMILNYNGLSDVRVEHVSGSLTDHYDPRTKVLRLSDSTYGSGSVAAIGVAAHECGHAVQDKDGYVPLKIRGALVPVANLGSALGLPIVILGLIFGLSYTFIQIGIWVFAAAVLFQIVTLPVEFNASELQDTHRGRDRLLQKGIKRGGSHLCCGRSILYSAASSSVPAGRREKKPRLKPVWKSGGS